MRATRGNSMKLAAADALVAGALLLAVLATAGVASQGHGPRAATKIHRASGAMGLRQAMRVSASIP